ncbi:MAG: hypothetical protein PUF45_04940 [Lachnospiraceae bacterium]|nr:hypothetical protein [Lachnospiraceae bacterium]
MLAQNDDVMTDAVSTICDISNDALLQQQIRAREEWLAIERRTQQEIAEQRAQLEEKDKRIAELEEALRQAQEALQAQGTADSKK